MRSLIKIELSKRCAQLAVSWPRLSIAWVLLQDSTRFYLALTASPNDNNKGCLSSLFFMVALLSLVKRNRCDPGSKVDDNMLVKAAPGQKCSY